MEVEEAAGIVVGGSYIINKETISIHYDGTERDLQMVPANTVVVVEELSRTEPFVTVSHNGLLCLIFAQDLIQRGVLVGIRIMPEILAMVASASGHGAAGSQAVNKMALGPEAVQYRTEVQGKSVY